MTVFFEMNLPDASVGVLNPTANKEKEADTSHSEVSALLLAYC